LQVRFLRQLCLAQAILLGFAIIATFVVRTASADTTGDILRVKGLIIEDAQGRPRILLGAPFPKVHSRKRQDDGSAAMLFLNETGADRLLVGEGISPQVGGKVYPPNFRAPQARGSGYGVTPMDGEGNERGGFGFTAQAGGGGRASIVLDRPTGDAWGALVDDKKQYVGMLLMDKKDNSRVEIALEGDAAPSFTVTDATGKPLGDVLQPFTKK
jgi:hypothetical protein